MAESEPALDLSRFSGREIPPLRRKLVSRTTMTTAFAVMLAASMPLAYAADTNTTAATPPKSATAVHTSVAANHIMLGQIRATQMNGATVYDAHGKSIGDIADVILDKQGKVVAVVLDVGSFLGIGGKH